jgi:hypothetical protein
MTWSCFTVIYAVHWLERADAGSPDEDADVRYESELVRQLSKHVDGDWRGDDDQELDHRHRHRVHGFFKRCRALF